MGATEFIITYKDNNDKNRINALIQKYKEMYLEWATNGESYHRYVILTDDIDLNLPKEERDILTKKLCDEHPEIDFTGINIYEDEINDEYQRYDLLIHTHQRITIRLNNKLENAIRVYFSMGATESFYNYLDRHKINYDTNYFLDFRVDEEYENILTDKNGLQLDDCI